MSAAVRILEGLADLVLPRRCVQCGRAGAWLCPACAPALRPMPATVCLRCGSPQTAGCVPSCPECRGRDLAFAAARAAFVYEGPARRLVTACKFRALRSLADEMAALAAPAFGELVTGAAASSGGTAVDVVTWVPLHRERGLERGFDQAQLLARGLARRHGLRCAPLLARRRRSRRQSGLSAAARRDNVRGAFEPRRGCFDCAEKVKNVVVVDDVYTTGETLQQCSEVLRRAGCEPTVFTFARAARRRASGDWPDRKTKEQGR